MAEYLERATLLASIQNLKRYLNTGIARRNLKQKDILNVIETLPAERVAPIVEATITGSEMDEWYCAFGKCSNCGEKIPTFSKFCLECGATMRGDG